MATGSIRKLEPTKSGKQRFQITIDMGRDPVTGKRERKFKDFTGTRRDAVNLMNQLISEANAGRTVSSSKMKVSEWVNHWLDNYLVNIEETTLVGYRTKIDNQIIPAVGEIRLGALTTDHIQMMINGMLERELSPKTIREAYNILNASLKAAQRQRLIPYNPCEGVSLPKLKKFKGEVYDVDEIQHVLAVAHGTDMYIPILLAVSVGLRRGEMLALRWEHIDFDKGIIHIRENLVRGAEEDIIKAPKSEAGIRDIHVGQDVLAALKEAKKQYSHDLMAFGADFNNAGYVIHQKDGSPMKPDSMTRKWRRFLTANDLRDIRLHDLRHSNATAMIAAGVNPKVVQERLGHADVSVTLNTYTHVLPQMDEEAAQKVDELLFKNA